MAKSGLYDDIVNDAPKGLYDDIVAPKPKVAKPQNDASRQAEIAAFDADTRAGVSHSAPEVARINALRKSLVTPGGPTGNLTPVPVTRGPKSGPVGNLTPVTPAMKAAQARKDAIDRMAVQHQQNDARWAAHTPGPGSHLGAPDQGAGTMAPGGREAPKIASSRVLQGGVNSATDAIQRWLYERTPLSAVAPGLSLGLTGLMANAATGPVQGISEVNTTLDAQRPTNERLGAVANLVRDLVLPEAAGMAGKLVKKGAQVISKTKPVQKMAGKLLEASAAREIPKVSPTVDESVTSPRQGRVNPQGATVKQTYSKGPVDLSTPSTAPKVETPTPTTHDPAKLVMPDGQPLVRHADDAARLKAMQEEFGPIEGVTRYVHDRMQSLTGTSEKSPVLSVGHEPSPIDAARQARQRLTAAQTHVDSLKKAIETARNDPFNPDKAGTLAPLRERLEAANAELATAKTAHKAASKEMAPTTATKAAQGVATAGTATKPAPATEAVPVNVVPTKSVGVTSAETPQAVGISNRAQAKDVESGAITQPTKGTALTPEQLAEKGKTVQTAKAASDLARDIAAGRLPVTAENIAKSQHGYALHHEEVDQAKAALDAAIGSGDKAQIAERQAGYDRAKADRQEFVDNVQKGQKTEWRNMGVAMQGQIALDTKSFSQVTAEARRLKGSDLKPKEEGQANFLTKRVADLEKKVQDMEASALKRDAEKQLAQAKSNRLKANVGAAMRGEKNVLVKESDYQQALKDLVPTSLNAGLDPKIAGALAKIATYHVERGARTAAEVAKLVMDHAASAGVSITETDAYHAIHEALGKVGRKANQGRKWGEDMLISGQSGYQSPEVAKMRRDLDLAKAKVHDFLESQRPKTMGERLVRYQQANILSSPMVFGKLAGATVGHAAISPVEEGFGSIVGRLFPGFREKAGTELRGSFKGEAKAIGELLNPKSYADAWQKLTTGHNSLGAKAIAEGIEKEGSGRGNVVLKLIRNSHGAVKTPLQRAAFAREYEKQMEAISRSGGKVDDGARATAFANAYAASQRAILMNDNAATRALNAFINNPKRNGKGGEAASAALKTMVPITRVATNFAGRSLEYQLGLPYAVAKAGIERNNMTPEVAGQIARAVKRGGVGAGLVVAGYNLPHNIKVDDKTGELKVDGVTVSPAIAHIPTIAGLKVGLSMRDAKGNLLGRYGEGLATSVLGSVKNTPMVDMARTTADATRSTKGAGKKAGQIAAGIAIPQIAQQYARGRDDAKDRKADNFWQELQKRTPFLREKLPPK